uniref:TNFR-Cys domain-containing protein n=1 Tax=Rhinolophus ferrumequinum TaxID=59479 RepID=A0A671EIS5_RHIFE
MPIPALSAQVPTASAVTTGQDRVHQQRAAPQEWKHMWCPPGFYLSEFSGDCAPCTRGMDFTSHSNNLSSCQVCSSCRPDEEEISSCTPTKDSECRCKSGTFLEENSPELCQRCSTRCPDGMVEAEPCTSWSDLQCVKQESGTQATGEAPVPGESVSTARGRPPLPFPPQAVHSRCLELYWGLCVPWWCCC